ncbi:MAG: hypothetical protein AAF531_21030 [Actinomycetota bacterium]
MGGLWHLTKRFFGAIRPGPPGQDDERWARSHLLPGEVEIWTRMNNPDRRHAVGVARSVVADPRLAVPPGEQIDREVVAAALLHDSGKILCRFRTPSRVLATVVWAVAPDETADRWLAERSRGYRFRLAQYRKHPRLGSELLQAAGAAPLTSRWAAEHHLPEAWWTVPVPVGQVLRDSDDD